MEYGIGWVSIKYSDPFGVADVKKVFPNFIINRLFRSR